LIVPVPDKLRLPPSIENTFCLASILLLFKLMLTVLLIFIVSSNFILFVMVIVSLFVAAFIASLSES